MIDARSGIKMVLAKTSQLFDLHPNAVGIIPAINDDEVNVVIIETNSSSWMTQ